MGFKPHLPPYLHPFLLTGWNRDQSQQFQIYSHPERWLQGRGSLCSPGVWKGLQEVSDVARIVKGRQTGGEPSGRLTLFLPYLLWHDFSKNPDFLIFSLKQVWWLSININEHNNNNKTGSSIKWMWSPATEIFTRCVLPVREILALNLDITSSSWADSRFQC